MPDSASKRVPKRIGAYDVQGVLGRGGMGEVYLATHELLAREVAIKRFAPKNDDAPADELKERFLREGKALAQLRHQGIVAVHDLFELRNKVYMVMERVDGYDVAKLLESGPLPLDVACIVGLKLTEALEHAHRRGIVHRDIKASNVMVSRDGGVKLMDFGIAKDDALEKVTRTGIIVGTPMYIAPEVVEGKSADGRSDIYGVGAFLYHCLSGRRIYEHASKENLFQLIVSNRYPPLQKVADDIPRRLRQIVHRCLARKPNKRYQSAAELRQSLEVFMAGQNIWAHKEERLVGFMKAKGHLTEKEAQTWLNASSLVISSTFEGPAAEGAGSMRWLVVASTLAALAGGGLWWAAAQGWLKGLLALTSR